MILDLDLFDGEAHNRSMTNDELNARADEAFRGFIESDFGDDLTPHERTLLMAKLAAKFATYAGDERDF